METKSTEEVTKQGEEITADGEPITKGKELITLSWAEVMALKGQDLENKIATLKAILARQSGNVLKSKKKRRALAKKARQSRKQNR